MIEQMSVGYLCVCASVWVRKSHIIIILLSFEVLFTA